MHFLYFLLHNINVCIYIILLQDCVSIATVATAKTIYGFWRCLNTENQRWLELVYLHVNTMNICWITMFCLEILLPYNQESTISLKHQFTTKFIVLNLQSVPLFMLNNILCKISKLLQVNQLILYHVCKSCVLKFSLCIPEIPICAATSLSFINANCNAAVMT